MITKAIIQEFIRLVLKARKNQKVDTSSTRRQGLIGDDIWIRGTNLELNLSL